MGNTIEEARSKEGNLKEVESQRRLEEDREEESGKVETGRLSRTSRSIIEAQFQLFMVSNLLVIYQTFM